MTNSDAIELLRNVTDGEEQVANFLQSCDSDVNDFYNSIENLLQDPESWNVLSSYFAHLFEVGLTEEEYDQSIIKKVLSELAKYEVQPNSTYAGIPWDTELIFKKNTVDVEGYIENLPKKTENSRSIMPTSSLAGDEYSSAAKDVFTLPNDKKAYLYDLPWKEINLPGGKSYIYIRATVQFGYVDKKIDSPKINIAFSVNRKLQEQ